MKNFQDKNIFIKVVSYTIFMFLICHGLFLNVVANEETKVKIIEHHMDHDLINVWVNGIAKNVAGVELSRIEIRVYFYDKDNIFLGSASDIKYNVPANATFKFHVEVHCLMDDFVSVKPEDITHYEIRIFTESSNGGDSIPGFEVFSLLIAIVTTVLLGIKIKKY